MPSPDAKRAHLLHQPGLAALIGGRTLSSLAYQMQAVVVGWQIYALTGSAFSLGLVGLAGAIPARRGVDLRGRPRRRPA
jgi:hypothetical protein